MPLWNDPELGKSLADSVQLADPGAKFDANTVFYSSCTDMGDVSTIMPAIHGYVPEYSGKSHGSGFRITDPARAYAGNAEVETQMLIDLLYGTGEKAKKIAEKKKNCMPIPEYIKLIRSLNRVLRTSGLS